MILVDSSAWIEFDRASGAATHLALRRLFAESRDQIAACEPVLMEVLAGARTDAQASRLRDLLASARWASLEPVADFEGAARIYRLCRADGVTPRNLDDCLIAAIAMRTDAELLTADRDFELIAQIVPLRLYAA